MRQGGSGAQVGAGGRPLARARAGLARARAGLALVGILACWAKGASAEEIKIEVLRGRPEVQLSAPGGHYLQGAEGAPFAARENAHLLAARGEALLLDGKPVRAPLLVRPGEGQLQVDGRKLPGRLEAWAEKGALVLVNALDLEDYVAAVVASEVPASWPSDALRAQAVAARTYAVAQKIAQGPGARAHLGSSVLAQVYAGAAHPKSGAREAARSTLGEVLTYGSAPIAAYFSASCGGKGESAEDAFGLTAGSLPYLPAQDDGDADQGAPRLSWAVRRTFAELTASLRGAKRLQAAVLGLAVQERTASGRARTVRIKTAHAQVSLSAAELRQILGYSALPSLFFEVQDEAGAVVFKGRGLGHGAGLCQWGARGRALRGERYQDILAHYYPGAEIRRMY